MEDEDVEEAVREMLSDLDGSVSAERETKRGDVVVQNAVCTECGSVNGRVSLRLDVREITEECPACDEFTVHECLVDAESSRSG